MICLLNIQENSRAVSFYLPRRLCLLCKHDIVIKTLLERLYGQRFIIKNTFKPKFQFTLITQSSFELNPGTTKFSKRA